MGEDGEPLGALDIGLAALAGACAASAVALQLLVVPRFVEMFNDFGSNLPVVTVLVLSGWPMIGAALVTIALGAAGLALRFRRRREAGLALLLFAVFVGLSADAFCLYALYAPIFELAGKIKP